MKKELRNGRGLPLLAAAGASSAAAALLLYHTSTNAGKALPGLMAFPFTWIGQGLRTLSLSGNIGNVAAWVLYLLAALVPIAAALALKHKGIGYKADSLLAVSSALLLPVLYGMINPNVLSRWFNAMLPVTQAQAVCGAAVWVCLLSWAVLRVMHALPQRSIGQLLGYLDGALTVLCLLLVVRACGIDLYTLLAELEALQQANTALSTAQLLPTRLFIGLYYLVEVLPSMLMIGVLRHGQRLLAVARTDRYSEEAVAAAQKLAAVCSRAVALSVLALLSFALAQLALAPLLYHLEANVTLPLGDVAMLLGTLVFAHWMAEGKALKDENEGFI